MRFTAGLGDILPRLGGDLLELQSASAHPYQPLHATGRNLLLALLLAAQLRIVACAILKFVGNLERCEGCKENQGLLARDPSGFVWVCPSCCSQFQESKSPPVSRGAGWSHSGPGGFTAWVGGFTAGPSEFTAGEKSVQSGGKVGS